jgi:hypothetical protein
MKKLTGFVQRAKGDLMGKKSLASEHGGGSCLLLVWAVALASAACSAGPQTPAGSAEVQAVVKPVDGAACDVPSAANTFDQASGTGCTAYPNECAAGQYALSCVGNPSPSPDPSLNCASVPAPVNTPTHVHYCCSCGN